MPVLKPLSRESIPRALEKAERYRLLNEPVDAESICEDILRVDPENQHALATFLLACTDQFGEELAHHTERAQEALQRLRDDYARAYYEGIVYERRAKAQLHRGNPGSGYVAYESLQRAMECYAKAESLRPKGNDDSVLRWNACARILEAHEELRPAPAEERSEMLLE
jgi:tetratricopeptide (TPR) repeat protein